MDLKRVRFNRSNYEVLTKMQSLATMGTLMKLFHVANWMRSAIPHFTKPIERLHIRLEEHYYQYKIKKKSHLHNRPLLEWVEVHQEALTSLTCSIVQQFTLKITSQTKRLFFYRRLIIALDGDPNSGGSK